MSCYDPDWTIRTATDAPPASAPLPVVEGIADIANTLDAASAEIERLRSALASRDAEIARLRSVIETVDRWADDFARHADTCPCETGDYAASCTCGWTDVRAALASVSGDASRG